MQTLLPPATKRARSISAGVIPALPSIVGLLVELENPSVPVERFEMIEDLMRRSAETVRPRK